MTLRFFTFIALVALSATASLSDFGSRYSSLSFLPLEQYSALIEHAPVKDEGHDEPHSIPHYEYKYGVHDPHTHDIKEKEESREHDHTRGHYSVHDPHYQRSVHYVVPDKHSGFIADFKYDVADPKHHDFKERAEKIDGHQITGHYAFLQPDGLKRIVHYTADKHDGFNAKVTYVKA